MVANFGAVLQFARHAQRIVDDYFDARGTPFEASRREGDRETEERQRGGEKRLNDEFPRATGRSPWRRADGANDEEKRQALKRQRRDENRRRAHCLGIWEHD